MANSRPDFHADYDGIIGFWKIFIFDQKNPIYKFAAFWAIISVNVHIYGPKFDLMDSFVTFSKVNENLFEKSKILQNLGIKSEYHQRPYRKVWWPVFESSHQISRFWV